VSKEIVRVIDLVIVVKDANGKVATREMQELDPALLAIFDPLKVQVTGIIQVEDIEMIGDKLDNNTTAAVLLFENLWAIKFGEAVVNANGRMVMFQRIPFEVVNEVLDIFAKAE
jgi:hypothetical protein